MTRYDRANIPAFSDDGTPGGTTWVRWDDYAALAARVERLEGALRAYGRHLANCNYKTIGCSCGLDAALEEPT